MFVFLYEIETKPLKEARKYYIFLWKEKIEYTIERYIPREPP